VKLEEEIKQSRFSSNKQKAALNVVFTAAWINATFRDILKPYNLTPQQYNVLRILKGRYPKSANPGEIKDVMLDKNPDLTRLCDRLGKTGLISRTIDRSNRRKMNIKITEKGIALLEEIFPRMNYLETAYIALNDNEAEELSNLLDKMRS
jgi:DNA-binding MarR family transcriptional regulator